MEDEKPLLLNPYFDDYEEHLEFLPTTAKITELSNPLEYKPPLPGGVRGKTERGAKSIVIMEIYRDEIRNCRLQAMDKARLEVKDALTRLLDSRDWDRFVREIIKTLSVDRPFRTAVYYEVREYLKAMRYFDEVDITNAFAALGFKG